MIPVCVINVRSSVTPQNIAPLWNGGGAGLRLVGVLNQPKSYESSTLGRRTVRKDNVKLKDDS